MQTWVNTQGIPKIYPKWLFRHKLKPKPVIPNITPFLSASHLYFVLPGQCRAHAFLRNRRRGEQLGRKTHTPTTLPKPSPSLLNGKEGEKLLHVLEEACGWFSPLVPCDLTWVVLPKRSRQIQWHYRQSKLAQDKFTAETHGFHHDLV